MDEMEMESGELKPKSRSKVGQSSQTIISYQARYESLNQSETLALKIPESDSFCLNGKSLFAPQWNG